ncbi:hypothetical protein [Hymenobacter arizonensis]|uniref:hypothetical protein n=1 Tax=Hymenobacter arizonensis TaxID=1227077 RepID=UPI0015A53D63|nr:hypothetical protein [Hymenobacter arizonensis]
MVRSGGSPKAASPFVSAVSGALSWPIAAGVHPTVAGGVLLSVGAPMAGLG